MKQCDMYAVILFRIVTEDTSVFFLSFFFNEQKELAIGLLKAQSFLREGLANANTLRQENAFI